MNATFERLFAPYTTAAEAVRVWQRLCAADGPAAALGPLAPRLAVSMVLREDVRRAVEAAAGRAAPAPGFLVQMSRLADRTRVTPLLYLADADPEVAAFLVRNPHAVEALLEAGGDGPPDDPWAFASGLPEGPHEFLEGTRWVAPLLLEGCGIDRRHAEAFLHHVHAPEVFGPLAQRLLAGRDVRAELTAVAAEFRRTSAVAAAPQGKPVEVDLVELIVRRFGESLRLVGSTLGADLVLTRGAAPAAVVVPLLRPGADVVVTVRPAPPDEFEVTLAVGGRTARRGGPRWEVRWSEEGAPAETALDARAGTASVRLRAGRYRFACVSAAGGEGARFRLVLEDGG